MADSIVKELARKAYAAGASTGRQSEFEEWWEKEGPKDASQYAGRRQER